MKTGMLNRIQRAASLSIFLLFLFIFVAIESATAQSSAHHKAPTKSVVTSADIVRDPTDVPPPLGTRARTVVHVTLVATEILGKLDPAMGATYHYWTFNGKVPGPMVRVKQDDTVEVTLRNDGHSTMVHSVDFHAALGPGGGADLSQVLPGESKTFTFKATTPGLFVYHCGTPMVAQHIANGMYGLILVEPPEGLPHADHEYYVMQGELYTASAMGTPGLQQFSNANLMHETPQYFVFNGAVEALSKEYPLHAEVGQTIRIYFGDAGPNATSSLHVVGEIFTRDYSLGSLTSPPLTGVQTVSVPPGGAAILELTARVPGKFTLMDHAMSRMAKGLLAVLEVTGAQNAALMHAGPAPSTTSSQASFYIGGMTRADIKQASKNDISFTPNVSVSETALSKTPAGHTLNSPRHGENGTSARQVNVSPTSSLHPVATKAKEINGCLLLQDDGKAMLQVLGSSKVYRLEAQPFLFSENAGRLVQVSGQFGSVLTVEDPRIPSFVVETVNALAPDCTTKISAAAIRRALNKNTITDGAIVTMSDIGFVPATVTIKAGQRVPWENSSAVVHDVVDDARKALYRIDVKLPTGGKQFDSGWLRPKESFSMVFTVPGVYRYVCTLHEAQGMKGVIVVRALPMFAAD